MGSTVVRFLLVVPKVRDNTIPGICFVSFRGRTCFKLAYFLKFAQISRNALINFLLQTLYKMLF